MKKLIRQGEYEILSQVIWLVYQQIIIFAQEIQVGRRIFAEHLDVVRNRASYFLLQASTAIEPAVKMQFKPGIPDIIDQFEG
ncbi:MAG: hypothetical protein DI632_05245 [Sphingomonas hengshuiensis]|uniref:Uncharacterized protein n=1 Tax=Sphingomonas hengshuiensis TaxID=1609977 RepID=A0A2W4ZEF4_9SPHN|nr:MAG: hypothetical protein DI632_05245 [Sphingomonas hengshuiensis]